MCMGTICTVHTLASFMDQTPINDVNMGGFHQVACACLAVKARQALMAFRLRDIDVTTFDVFRLNADVHPVENESISTARVGGDHSKQQEPE